MAEGINLPLGGWGNQLASSPPHLLLALEEWKVKKHWLHSVSCFQESIQSDPMGTCGARRQLSPCGEQGAGGECIWTDGREGKAMGGSVSRAASQAGLFLLSSLTLGWLWLTALEAGLTC